MRLSPHDPNLGVFLAVLGACHLLLKHADQATDLLRRARAANPQYWYIHFWLAGALGFKGNLDEARQSVPPPSSGAFDCGKARGTESLQTPRWREMDSNFQYASTVRWHRATDLPLPPTVKRRSAGRPPPMARPRSEAQRGSVRPAAAMRSTDREMRCSVAMQAARYRAARRAAMRSAAVKCRTAAVDGGYAMVAVWLITLTPGGSVKTVALQCMTRGTAVLVYDAGDLAGIERARHDEVLRSGRGVDLAFGGDRRRRDGRRAGWQQARMRDASGVHQLQEDQAAPRVDRVGDALPRVDLRHGVDARRAHVAFAHRRRGGAFGDDQAGVGALSVEQISSLPLNPVS